MVKAAKEQAENILPLYMNGLAGRMLRLPPPRNKKREILIVPGVHTSIERLAGLGEYLNRFGGITLPDLPGHGGMEPFYKIGEKPTIDNYADYLAAFIKLRYRHRRVTIIAISFAFPIVTRMLQKYPQLAKKVDLLISLSGFVSKDDFRWRRRNLFLLKFLASTASNRLVSAIIKAVFLRGPIIRFIYRMVEARHPKFRDLKPEERRERINFEIRLWKINDFRTYVESGAAMTSLKLLRRHVDLSVHHIAVNEDHYFNNVLVEQHMREIFKDFVLYKTKMKAHMPTVIASADEFEVYLPPKIRALLRKRVS